MDRVPRTALTNAKTFEDCWPFHFRDNFAVSTLELSIALCKLLLFLSALRTVVRCSCARFVDFSAKNIRGPWPWPQQLHTLTKDHTRTQHNLCYGAMRFALGTADGTTANDVVNDRRNVPRDATCMCVFVCMHRLHF